MTHRVVRGIGDRPIREGDRSKWSRREGGYVPAVVLGPEDRLVAFPALRLADVWRRLRLQGMGLAIRAGRAECGRDVGGPLLEVATAEEPAGFGIIGRGGELTECVAGLVGPAGPQQESRELLDDPLGGIGAVPLVGSSQGARCRRASAAPAGSDCSARTRPSIRLARASQPGWVNRRSAARAASLSRSSRKKAFSRATEGLDVVHVAAQGLPPGEDAVLLLPQVHQGLAPEEEILGRHEVVRLAEQVPGPFGYRHQAGFVALDLDQAG